MKLLGNSILMYLGRSLSVTDCAIDLKTSLSPPDFGLTVWIWTPSSHHKSIKASKVTHERSDCSSIWSILTFITLRIQHGYSRK